ncbi:alpha/beta fold hydrolase [Ktedonosporobacter rubrisoli]|uniref:Alpha/beta fold hydrolase n=1 Tax=Ktedonosporobacter rubrisoli TaxID=2509675 RepID=A0A4P6JN49_KTERU|nr:alpha/beta hydrolase [Ktedonosporobacter rubrisoli]QBD76684.1 alpha/beta fold hydrolase [Ktedonosporobacter rubrisoli]
MTTENPQATPEIGKSILAAGVMTNYHEAGSGAPVILIHGSGPGVSAWANWRFAIPALAERLHVFAYDQLGFGYTQLPERNLYNLDLWTEHLFSFMQAVGIQKAHLVGNSMGSAVALAAAISHPEKVERLVLMGAMGVRFPLTEGLNTTWGYTPSVANMRRLLDIFAYNRALVSDQLAELRYQASIRPGMQEAFASMFPAPRQQGVDALAHYEDRLSTIEASTLIIHGREDRVIPLQTGLDLMQTLPNAQLHVFGHCGHWTQLEHVKTFNRLVRDFLAEGE